MKNERIITHFQSYTTADSCVKDLTPYFAGRISVISTKRDVEGYQNAEAQADTTVQTVTELGGITLGTVATLVPGLGPVLTGGPVAGQAIGDAIGSYINSQRHQNGGEDDPFVNQRGRGARDTSAASMVIVMVDVNSEEEAERAAQIMAQHAERERPGTGVDPTDHGVTEIDDNSDVSDVVDYSYYTAAPPGDDVEDGYPQETGRTVRRIPIDDGYQLDPLRPLSKQGWVDVNIGYGNLDLVDPSLTYAPDLAEENGEENEDGYSR